MSADPGADGARTSWRPACGAARPPCIEMMLWRVPGLFVVHKPPGPSSFGVIRAVRRALGVRKIGHAGTLDPIAEGVLVLGVGRCTGVLQALTGLGKSYRVRLTLGRRTDSFDATGRVLEERDASAIDARRFEEALAPFRGRIAQTPPMFSALKHGGRPLYRLAREGVRVERRARTIEIGRLALVAFEHPDAVLELDCSRGTYVRSLVDDLGASLGCGAVMTGLVRTRVGPFTIEEARRPGDLAGTLPP